MGKSWKDWVLAFARAYRTQAAELSEREKALFGEYVEEQCLSKPCQVEVFEFDDPYGLVLIFILNTEADFAITLIPINGSPFISPKHIEKD